MTRSLRHADVIAAARALIAVPPQSRAALCARLFREADWADRFTRNRARPHPLWGNGTLLAAACAYRMLPEPTFDDPEYRAAFITVLQEVDRRKTLE